MRFLCYRNRHTPSMPQHAISHAAILAWFRGQLPNQDEEKDALIYHQPIRQQKPYMPERFWASNVILSLTPTEGVYERLNRDRSAKAVFLHRPWGLDRRRVPYGTLVMQSHQRFDEMYTTGYNISFALKHNVDLDTVRCLQGYKGDPERRIGLLGMLRVETTLEDCLSRIIEDFSGAETVAAGDDLTKPVRAIASLNAFNSDIIERVQTGFEGIPAETILCITGASREAGLTAAKEYGMPVLCVGHRRSELWGVRHFAETIRKDLDIHDVYVVDEAEEVMQRRAQADTPKDLTSAVKMQNP